MKLPPLHLNRLSAPTVVAVYYCAAESSWETATGRITGVIKGIRTGIAAPGNTQEGDVDPFEGGTMKETAPHKLRLISPIASALGLLVCTLVAFQLSGNQTAYAALAASPLDVVISEIAWTGTAVSGKFVISANDN